MNLNELTLDDIGSWPSAARILVIAVVCVMILILFFMFDVRPMRAKLAQAASDENDLKSSFQVKYSQVTNYAAYQKQVQQLSQDIRGMLEQLPEHLDVPDLIGDISKVGNQAGLQFNYIKPLSEVTHDYYTQLPIKISVNGNYQQLAQFVANLAKMPRIVTLDSFTISREKLPTGQLNNPAGSIDPTKTALVMDITANTYRQTSKKKTNTAGATTNE
jgi:type IV pilus assembly protein PilO